MDWGLFNNSFAPRLHSFASWRDCPIAVREWSEDRFNIMLHTVPGRYGIAILVSGLSLGYLQALGSSEFFTTLGRYGFWLGSCAAGWIQAMLIARGIRSLLEGMELAGWQLLIVSALILTFPLTFEIRWMWQLGANGGGSASSYWQSFMVISVLNLGFSFVQYRFLEKWPLGRALVRPLSASVGELGEAPLSDEAEEKARENKPALSMLRKVPEGLEGELLAVQVEDHYLRIYTDKGSNLVLGQLSGVCHDLRGCDGQQVHRSWWVSVAAIAELRKAGRDSEILMSNGIVVPVSRSKLQELRNRLSGD